MNPETPDTAKPAEEPEPADLTAYELVRKARIESNKRRMSSLVTQTILDPAQVVTSTVARKFAALGNKVLRDRILELSRKPTPKLQMTKVLLSSIEPAFIELNLTNLVNAMLAAKFREDPALKKVFDDAVTAQDALASKPSAGGKAVVKPRRGSRKTVGQNHGSEMKDLAAVARGKLLQDVQDGARKVSATKDNKTSLLHFQNDPTDPENVARFAMTDTLYGDTVSTPHLSKAMEIGKTIVLVDVPEWKGERLGHIIGRDDCARDPLNRSGVIFFIDFCVFHRNEFDCHYLDIAALRSYNMKVIVGAYVDDAYNACALEKVLGQTSCDVGLHVCVQDPVDNYYWPCVVSDIKETSKGVAHTHTFFDGYISATGVRKASLLIELRLDPLDVRVFAMKSQVVPDAKPPANTSTAEATALAAAETPTNTSPTTTPTAGNFPAAPTTLNASTQPCTPTSAPGDSIDMTMTSPRAVQLAPAAQARGAGGAQAARPRQPSLGVHTTEGVFSLHEWLPTNHVEGYLEAVGDVTQCLSVDLEELIHSLNSKEDLDTFFCDLALCSLKQHYLERVFDETKAMRQSDKESASDFFARLDARRDAVNFLAGRVAQCVHMSDQIMLTTFRAGLRYAGKVMRRLHQERLDISKPGEWEQRAREQDFPGTHVALLKLREIADNVETDMESKAADKLAAERASRPSPFSPSANSGRTPFFRNRAVSRPRAPLAVIGDSSVATAAAATSTTPTPASSVAAPGVRSPAVAPPWHQRHPPVVKKLQYAEHLADPGGRVKAWHWRRTRNTLPLEEAVNRVRRALRESPAAARALVDKMTARTRNFAHTRGIRLHTRAAALRTLIQQLQTAMDVEQGLYSAAGRQHHTPLASVPSENLGFAADLCSAWSELSPAEQRQAVRSSPPSSRPGTGPWERMDGGVQWGKPEHGVLAAARDDEGPLLLVFYAHLKGHQVQLLKKSLRFLGHTISADGCRPQHDKVAAQWAFEELKAALISAPVLALPDTKGAADGSAPFVVQTDASGIALGGVLMQDHGDGLRVIAYESRQFSAAEQNYHTGERELGALHHCTTVTWRHYLIFTNFRLQGDHRPLEWLMEPGRELSRRQARWYMDLVEVGVPRMEYIKGALLMVPDALSRRPDYKDLDAREGLREAGVLDPVSDLPTNPLTSIDAEETLSSTFPASTPPWIQELNSWLAAADTLQAADDAMADSEDLAYSFSHDLPTLDPSVVADLTHSQATKSPDTPQRQADPDPTPPDSAPVASRTRGRTSEALHTPLEKDAIAPTDVMSPTHTTSSPSARSKRPSAFTPSDRQDWRVRKSVFEKYQKQFGIFDVDACCDLAGHNRQVDRYWHDCLKEQWRGLHVWCNPPYSSSHLTIEAVLRKYVEEWRADPDNTSAVFILPDLQARAPAWRKLFRMAGMRVVEVIPTHNAQGEPTQLFESPDGRLFNLPWPVLVVYAPPSRSQPARIRYPRVSQPVLRSGDAAELRDAGPVQSDEKFLKALRAEYDRPGPLCDLRKRIKDSPHQCTRYFRLVGGVLWRVAAGRYQLVLGEDSPLREVVFWHSHDSHAAGHTGRDKTLERVLRRFWWKGATEDVGTWVASCATCQAELMRLMGLKVARTTPYNPRSDGQAEHTNRVIEDMLRSFVDANVTDWDLFATNVEFAINDSRSEATGYTPFELCCGVSPLSQLDLFLEAARGDARRRQGGVGTAHEFAAKFSSQLRDAKHRLELAQQRQREQFDRRHAQREYAIGDLVWIEAKNLTEKHRLKPYVSGKGEFAARDQPAIPEAVVVDGQREAHVERILSRRVRLVRGKELEEWKVRWTGYSKAHDQWRTRDKLEHGGPLQQLREFEAARISMEAQRRRNSDHTLCNPELECPRKCTPCPRCFCDICSNT
ncbi:hypothetical protein CYMTET_4043 [Cymbomonas tetramitiformis]|uniref:Chromo domain-containing protein n=1 Tax=Cymbomonas tetramitiformis TaxID=36881 RepID=A0AAE0H269_9CHLO|nr:hypothetical protein CYMTET_4043 [Cymbomonas tetramitiformis]